MKEKNAAHGGHRQRLRERFDRYGLDSFSDLNALELLLFYALPRQDTNPLAHALLDKFGSLESVFEAEPEELREVPGMGESAALFLQLIPALSRRYLIRKANQSNQIADPEAAGEYLLPYFLYEQQERVYGLFLDNHFRVLVCEELSKGVINAAEIGVRALINRALELNCCYLILAHNHPSGLVTPSAEDEYATLRLQQVLNTAGISLIDHLIVAEDSFMSMCEVGTL